MQNKNYITINSIREQYNTYIEMSCRPSFSKVRPDYIFDEDKSVKWNREQAILNNEKYSAELSALNTRKNKARDAIYKSIYNYIQQEIGNNFSENKAKAVFNYIDDIYDGNIYDILNHVDDLIELICIVITPERQFQKEDNDYER